MKYVAIHSVRPKDDRSQGPNAPGILINITVQKVMVLDEAWLRKVIDHQSACYSFEYFTYFAGMVSVHFEADAVE